MNRQDEIKYCLTLPNFRIAKKFIRLYYTSISYEQRTLEYSLFKRKC